MEICLNGEVSNTKIKRKRIKDIRLKQNAIRRDMGEFFGFPSFDPSVPRTHIRLTSTMDILVARKV